MVRALPDVYVVGNQAALQAERRTVAGKDVLLVALPVFASSGTAAVVDLERLRCSAMEFSAEAIEGEEAKAKAKQAAEGDEETAEDDFVIEENIENEEEWSVCCRKQGRARRSAGTGARWPRAAAG